jgi:methionyl aminopeptidase
MTIGRNDPCFCGSGKKWKKCHFPTLPPVSKADNLAAEYYKKYRIILKNKEQIEGIRAACKLASKILKAALNMAKEGVTTNEINALVEKMHKDAGAIAAPLGYGNPPFPKSTCTSVNEVICHGIPNDTPLKNGDIMNIDVSPILNGYYGDTSGMVIIGGKTTAERQLVYDVSKECLKRACTLLKPGILLHEIGDVISDYAQEKGCSVVHQFVGHGVGIGFHEPPQILHSRNDNKIPLAPGMTFTIEPMINAGRPEAIIDDTGWIARTVDGKASAQWEHTVLITETGAEILTL